jgi:hypothetical protein
MRNEISIKFRMCLSTSLRNIFALVVVVAFAGQIALAQTTEFVFQGQLQNSSAPASGNHDFEFRLFDAVSGGVQVGTTLTRSSVSVANGTFAVKLDFGGQFPGANRFLEIHVRQTGGGAFTPLTPRQAVSNTPYAVKSLTADNATQLGGVAANQYVTTASGGANFIQNTTTQQAASNFNVSGNGTVGNSVTIENGRITFKDPAFPVGNFPIYSGISSEVYEPTFGVQLINFGINSGREGTRNGNRPGYWLRADTRSGNRGFHFFKIEGFPGTDSELMTIADNGNVGIGTSNPTNRLHVAGNGLFKGRDVRVESDIAGVFPRFSLNFTGGAADEKKWQNYAAANRLSFTALNDAEDAETEWLVVNRGIGTNISSVTFPNGNVGIGTTTPGYRLDVADRVRIKQNPAEFGASNSAGLWLFQNIPNANQAFVGMENDNSVGLYGQNGGGWGLLMSTQTGVVKVASLGAAGATTLCRNASNEISTCSSSLKYKTNIGRFLQGMEFVNKLHPISFDWKDGGTRDVGFGAEDIAKIDPRFVTYNSKGEVEGVKYDRLSVAFVNAFKEQQEQIDQQQKQLQRQQSEIEALKVKVSEVEALKQLVCSQNPTAESCKPKE